MKNVYEFLLDRKGAKLLAKFESEGMEKESRELRSWLVSLLSKYPNAQAGDVVCCSANPVDASFMFKHDVSQVLTLEWIA